MKLHRIQGLLLRFLFSFRRNLDRLTDVFYWPATDLLLWGLTSVYFTEFSSNGKSVTLIVLTGVVLWYVINRSQNEVAINLLDDLWNRNLVNIFVSPLTFAEWVISFLLTGIVKTVISLSFAVILTFLLYKITLLSYGIYLLLFVTSLLITGWIMGFIVAGVVLRFGTRLQTLGWTAVWLLSPFCGLYYPISILPHWAQTIAAGIPASYVFEAGREFVATGSISMAKLYVSFGLNCFYLVIALWFLKSSFKAVLKKGLVKVY